MNVINGDVKMKKNRFLLNAICRLCNSWAYIPLAPVHPAISQFLSNNGRYDTEKNNKKPSGRIIARELIGVIPEEFVRLLGSNQEKTNKFLTRHITEDIWGIVI